MTVRIIDIETTGTDPASDAIIEIASVDLQAEDLLFASHDQPALIAAAFDQ